MTRPRFFRTDHPKNLLSGRICLPISSDNRRSTVIYKFMHSISGLPLTVICFNAYSEYCFKLCELRRALKMYPYSTFKGDRPKEPKVLSKVKRKPMTGFKSALLEADEVDSVSAQQNLTMVSQVPVKFRFNPRTSSIWSNTTRIQLEGNV